MKEKKRFKDYQEYLKSPQWKVLRKKTYDRVKKRNGILQCEVCGLQEEKIYDVHHWQYPKDWNNDKAEYHLLVCRNCHSEIHKLFDNDTVFVSRDNFLKHLFKMKYEISNEERVEFYNLLGIAITSKELKLSQRWNYSAKSFDGLLELNGYTVYPPLEELLINLFKKRECK